MQVEKVKKSHNCYRCRKRLKPGDKRIFYHHRWLDRNFCIPCGYKVIKDNTEEEHAFLSEVKRKFGKEIVIAMLKNDSV